MNSKELFLMIAGTHLGKKLLAWKINTMRLVDSL